MVMFDARVRNPQWPILRIAAKDELPEPQEETMEDPPTIADRIRIECDALKSLLLEKNRAYGNSALDPVRIFSKASPVEQILVRLDDKISRLSRGEAQGEDVTQDLLGYLILLRIAQKLERSTSASVP